MVQIDLVPQRTSDGSVALRAVVIGPGERVRRFLRKLRRRRR
jgi:hypothetical protein